MSNKLERTDPKRFGLTSFADLLAARAPMLGEVPGSYAAFHAGLMGALTPFTPYECVMAENLVAIEWELVQHRRMRDADLRRGLREAVERAARDWEDEQRDQALDAAGEAFLAAGGSEEAWEEPAEFSRSAAVHRAADLADRAVSGDPDVQAAAQTELAQKGLSPLDLMSAVYTDYRVNGQHHDAKIRELERRRREGKRDYDALQRTRPVEAEISDAEIAPG